VPEKLRYADEAPTTFYNQWRDDHNGQSSAAANVDPPLLHALSRRRTRDRVAKRPITFTERWLKEALWCSPSVGAVTELFANHNIVC
jgi:hypothetical protein